MKRIYNIIYIVALACLMVVACGKEETLIPNNRIETHEVVIGDSFKAKCSSTVEIGENYLTDRGVCWSTNPEPTIDDNHVSNGKKVGILTSELNNLTGNTTYYVRAYATNQIGTHYGNELTFSTPEITLPVLTTQNVTSITANIARCGGNITSDGWSKVTARGVCWSTSPNPTIEDNKTEDGTGTGSFTSNITGLAENTTYYVRAYATNQIGTHYGNELTFSTPEITLPVLTTQNVTSITANIARCGGNITSDGWSKVTARGVCWSTSPNPTIEDNKTEDGTGTGSFTSNITGLAENTTYYVRAYATNEKGTAYGEEKSFTTNGSINGYEWVDLGLPSGLKWATCNVGATTPEGYGNYYAWGEITTKESYNEFNCTTYGQQISDFSGNAAYDAARANWGSTWRMPTKVEMEELENNCTWTWTTQNGVNGYRVTGPNGNSIFLHAAGWCIGSSRNFVGEICSYWSSTPDESSINHAYALYFPLHSVNCYNRYYGHTVRPVSE